VTSGTSVVGVIPPGSTVALQNPQAVIGSANFVGSGTSFSSAITAGAVALLLHGHGVSPDDVKADLLGSASAGPAGDPFVDGHGMLNIVGAYSNKFHLKQQFGQVRAAAGVPSGAIPPGQPIQAGYKITMPGKHSAASVSLAGGQVEIPVSCNGGGPTVGQIDVDLVPTTWSFNANAENPISTPSGLQGSSPAEDFCNGAPMFQAGQGAQVVSTGALISNDTNDPASVSFQVYTGSKTFNEGTSTAAPVAENALGDSTDLGAAWASSTWNPALWNGLPSSVTNQTSISSAPTDWTGHVWNGSVWNGHVWNGHVWNGHVWNGSTWNGNAWDGHVWNGSAWNGHVWNGNAWGATGNTYDGTPVTGSS
jgi:hypothetical protein